MGEPISIPGNRTEGCLYRGYKVNGPGPTIYWQGINPNNGRVMYVDLNINDVIDVSIEYINGHAAYLIADAPASYGFRSQQRFAMDLAPEKNMGKDKHGRWYPIGRYRDPEMEREAELIREANPGPTQVEFLHTIGKHDFADAVEELSEILMDGKKVTPYS